MSDALFHETHNKDSFMQLDAMVEAVLMAAKAPLTINDLCDIFRENGISNDEMTEVLEALQETLSGRGVELVEVASGWRLQVPARYNHWVERLFEERQERYSSALFETLALIAYQQPVTRGEIESVRGVAVSTNIIRTLEEREWIKVVGRKETPGRPLLYATTEKFLDDFNLKSLEELPLLEDSILLDEAKQREVEFNETQTRPASA
ncbi:SMC-Scp complex subunit ScpB [Ignatzschineria sp. RMDPL8A]|uniref:SMC-Scp complex subunit ScpB n=1 Tax=Ignatzschineria sp. RMDPL8A TaxID=2999236 RepID=UPI0016AD94D9|nr:SMC-Scp complex subunit ScpB [Ignatzschineria sp. RMDPL8A]MDG9729175.1 SMC-Scp complex subunit ScpB [Ignatzschineria sp. RMDPL8A]NLD08349.1 SMC-Scp complex subunit ScpB [Xanthomonadaceae bacterium]